MGQTKRLKPAVSGWLAGYCVLFELWEAFGFLSVHSLQRLQGRNITQSVFPMSFRSKVTIMRNIHWTSVPGSLITAQTTRGWVLLQQHRHTAYGKITVTHHIFTNGEHCDKIHKQLLYLIVIQNVFGITSITLLLIFKYSIYLNKNK